MISKSDVITAKRNRKSCFTLLEVMISMGVFAILMLALMQFFVSAQAVVERTSERATFYDDARIAMNLLANDLMCTFYAPEYDGTQYTFMSYNKSDKAKITFATMRSDGMTEVYYLWNTATMQLKVKTLKEESIDFTSTTTTPTWVTRPNSGWVTSFQSDISSAVVIAENVVAFEIILKDNASTPTEITVNLPNSTMKIPHLAEITMKIISKDALEKLKAMSADFSTLTAPQQEIFDKGTQTFKRIVLIDRGQYN